MSEIKPQLRPHVIPPKPGEPKDFAMTRLCPVTDDFYFDQDALVILNPFDVVWEAPLLARSTRTLAEHVQLVQERQLRKVFVIAEDISFLRECPSLESVRVTPAYSVQGKFDYSPLYDLPGIQELICKLTTGPQERRCASVDYRRFPNLRRLYVEGTQGHIGLSEVKGLTYLCLSKWKPAEKSLEALELSSLTELDVCQCGLHSLAGLEKATQLRKASLSYCRSLEDLSALTAAGETLTSLEIEACGKISDFTWLNSLTELEDLTLWGSNTLPDLKFLRYMKKLRSLRITMNVADGDLSLCREIPYVHCRNRKHNHLKNEELPKGKKQS